MTLLNFTAIIYLIFHFDNLISTNIHCGWQHHNAIKSSPDLFLFILFNVDLNAILYFKLYYCRLYCLFLMHNRYFSSVNIKVLSTVLVPSTRYIFFFHYYYLLKFLRIIRKKWFWPYLFIYLFMDVIYVYILMLLSFCTLRHSFLLTYLYFSSFCLISYIS